MDSRHLRSFVAVAERLSFRQAAERVYASQPTVTGHIQALEREVGAALFERGGRSVRLTAAGERLLPYARQVLALEAEAVEAVRAWRRGYDERLRIVASIFVAASGLPRALRTLAERRPRVEVSLRTAFSQEVLEAIGRGEAELGLSRLAPPGGAGAGRRLTAEPVVPVAPAAWGAVTLAEALAAHPLLTHNHPGYWDRLLGQLQALGLAFRPMEVRQVEVTCRLIQEGLGLSFLPVTAAAGPGLQVLPAVAGLDLPETGTWALWPRGRSPSAAAAELLDLLAQAADGRPGAWDRPRRP
jgi:LysR family transcriptional repressor of citA